MILFDATLTKPLALKDQVYRAVREQLRQGAIALEDRLVDASIAESLSISRTPVREALQMLVHEGLLEATTRGFKLRQLSPKEITDLFEVRLLLEPKVAGKAAASPKTGGKSALLNSVEMARSSTENHQTKDFNAAAFHFFENLVALSDNVQMNRSVLLYHDRLAQLRVPLMATAEQRKLAVDGFGTITDAVAKGDVQGAERAAWMHIQNGLRVCQDLKLTDIEPEGKAAHRL